MANEKTPKAAADAKAPAAKAPAKAEKPTPERYEVRLTSPQGGEQLRFRAEKVKTGTGFVFYGFHNTIQLVEGKRKKMAGKGRGATQSFPDLASAKAMVDKAVKRAEEMGWKKSLRGGGGPRVDAFDFKTLPAPEN